MTDAEIAEPTEGAPDDPIDDADDADGADGVIDDDLDDLFEDEPASRWPSPLAIAACASIGAGGIHAAVVGGRGDHRTVAMLFAWTAAIQVVWGITTLLRPRPISTALGMAANFGFAAAWLLTRIQGVSFVAGLDTREKVQFADATAAGLGIVAAAIAFGALLIPQSAREHRLTNIAVPAFVVAALVLPAMITTATHVHGAGTGSGHNHGAAPVATTSAGPVVAAEVSVWPSWPRRPRP